MISPGFPHMLSSMEVGNGQERRRKAGVEGKKESAKHLDCCTDKPG